MKNRGFTLIELLGVIIILSLLVLLVFPNIANSTKNYSKKTDDLTLKIIYDASDMYISNHQDDFPKYDGNKYTIDLTDLVSEGLLSSPIKYGSSNDITNSKCVQVMYNNDTFSYEIKNSGDCEIANYICKLQVGTSQAVGSKYICHLDTDRTFYVLENDESSDDISLIMDQNIGSTVAWCSYDDYIASGGTASDWNSWKRNLQGPVTVTEYLARQTSSWGVTTTLPTRIQISNANNRSASNLGMWLVDYLKDGNNYSKDHPVEGIEGYWTLSPGQGSLSTACVVYYDGTIYISTVGNDATIGIRPVITIPKTRLN